VLQYNPDKTFTEKGPDMLPKLHVPDVIRITNNLLEQLRCSTGLDFIYSHFVSERELYHN